MPAPVEIDAGIVTLTSGALMFCGLAILNALVHFARLFLLSFDAHPVLFLRNLDFFDGRRSVETLLVLDNRLRNDVAAQSDKQRYLQYRDQNENLVQKPAFFLLGLK